MAKRVFLLADHRERFVRVKALAQCRHGRHVPGEAFVHASGPGKLRDPVQFPVRDL